jgi:PAS domain-containing protein
LLVLDRELCVVSANRAFYRQFKASAAETERRLIYELGHGQWNIPKLRQLLERVLPQKISFEDFEMECDYPGVGRRRVLINARRLEQHPTQPARILLAMEDVTQPRAQSPSARNMGEARQKKN